MLILLFGLILAYLYYSFYYKRLAYPWGPTPIPLIGNILQLAPFNRFEIKLLAWAKEFGPIYTYWIGETPIVSVNDPKLAYQMFVKDGENYVDRGKICNFQQMIGESEAAGIVFSNGELWKEQRRFAIKFLRDFGLGKHDMQDRILQEVQTIIEKINNVLELNLDEYDFEKYIDIGVGSIINSLVLGYRFTENKQREEEFYRLKNLSLRVLNIFANPILLIARFNERIEKFTYKYMNSYYKPMQDLFDFIDEKIKERIETEDVHESMDMVDAFLMEKARQKRLNLSTADLYTSQQLRSMVFDMWFAGQETTSATITWAIAYIICNPEVQRKIHDELDREINGDRLITVADRPRLNYINAFIMEVQRSANIVTQNLLRYTAKDVVVEWHKIRKGTYCVLQLCTIHYDPDNFDEPTKFKPERFLDSDNQLIKNDAFMPFSLGKRVCIGEGLAKMELFLFLANLCNQYEFSAGKTEPELIKYPFGGSTGMKPYKCRAKRRFT